MTKYRQHVASPKFSIRFAGLVSTGGLVGLQSTESEMGKGNYHYCTPNQEKVSQMFVTEDGALWKQPDLLKYHEEKDKDPVYLSREDMDAMAAAKKPTMPLNEAHISVHPIRQCLGQMFPNGEKKSFVFTPQADSPESVQVYDYILAMCEKFGIVAEINVNHHQGLYRFRLWRGQLVLEPQVYTEQLRDIPTIENPEVDTDALERRFSLLATDYNQETYINESEATVLRIFAGAAGEVDGHEIAEAIEEPDLKIDLLAMLDLEIEKQQKENA
jgi:hypothetical protein